MRERMRRRKGAGIQERKGNEEEMVWRRGKEKGLGFRGTDRLRIALMGVKDQREKRKKGMS